MRPLLVTILNELIEMLSSLHSQVSKRIATEHAKEVKPDDDSDELDSDDSDEDYDAEDDDQEECKSTLVADANGNAAAHEEGTAGVQNN